MRSAIQYASERGKGGILMTGGVNVKTVYLVSEILESKHPVGTDIKTSSLPIFGSYPELINIEMIENNVEKVAKRLLGSTDLSGIDSVYMSHGPLKFGGTSTNLHRRIGKLVELLANDYLP